MHSGHFYFCKAFPWINSFNLAEEKHYSCLSTCLCVCVWARASGWMNSFVKVWVIALNKLTMHITGRSESEKKPFLVQKIHTDKQNDCKVCLLFACFLTSYAYFNVSNKARTHVYTPKHSQRHAVTVTVTFILIIHSAHILGFDFATDFILSYC